MSKRRRSTSGMRNSQRDGTSEESAITSNEGSTLENYELQVKSMTVKILRTYDKSEITIERAAKIDGEPMTLESADAVSCLIRALKKIEPRLTITENLPRKQGTARHLVFVVGFL